MPKEEHQAFSPCMAPAYAKVAEGKRNEPRVGNRGSAELDGKRGTKPPHQELGDD